MSMVKYYYCDFSELIFASMKYTVCAVPGTVPYCTRARAR